MKPVNFIWSAVYVVLAVYILRWARGLLPIAAVLAVLLLVIAAISGFGLAGTSWFDRNHHGYAPAQSLFGGQGLSNDLLGTITLLLIPVQLALIVFAMIGFSQGWNVEVEVPEEEARRRGSKPIAYGPQAPAAA
jgi:nitric oxide reductase large subunit